MFHIQIADLIVQIDNLHEEIQKRCRDYIVEPDREPDLIVRADEQQMNLVRTYLQDYEGTYHTFEDPEGVVEFHSLHREIYPRLPEVGALWLHASAVAVDGLGFCFTARSGYGKTTQSMLWKKEFGDRLTIVNGDNPIIRRKNGVFHIFGTPFGGSEGYNANMCAPLKAICYLEHSDETHAIPMSQTMAFAQLMRDSNYVLYKADSYQDALPLWQKVAEDVPVYKLCCTLNENTARLAYASIMSN